MARIAGQPSSTDFLHNLTERNANEVTIVVTPAFDRKGKRRHELFEVRLLGHPDLICISSQPLCDCSHALLAHGFSPFATINKVRSDRLDVVSMKSTIGKAAELVVMGSRFVKRT
jgi:hypothetical protein